MSQSLIVDDTEVDVGRELLTGDTRVHGLVSKVVVAGLEKLLAEVVDWGIVVGESEEIGRRRRKGREKKKKTSIAKDEKASASACFSTKSEKGQKAARNQIQDVLERRRILSHSMHRSRLTRQTLDKHTNRHSTRERVRVDDDIGLHPALGEGHVDSRPLLGANTLLTVSRGELVTNRRGTRNSDLDMNFLRRSIARIVTYKVRIKEGAQVRLTLDQQRFTKYDRELSTSINLPRIRTSSMYATSSPLYLCGTVFLVVSSK